MLIVILIVIVAAGVLINHLTQRERVESNMNGATYTSRGDTK